MAVRGPYMIAFFSNRYMVFHLSGNIVDHLDQLELVTVNYNLTSERNSCYSSSCQYVFSLTRINPKPNRVASCSSRVYTSVTVASILPITLDLFKVLPHTPHHTF